MARDIHETARKLRALASSPNEHEAARAQEAFRAFIARHQIREADLAEPPMFDEFIRQTLEASEAIRSKLTVAYMEAKRTGATSERFEIEYLRRLPSRYREKQLRRMPFEQQARYRQAFEALRQVSEERRRARRLARGLSTKGGRS